MSQGFLLHYLKWIRNKEDKNKYLFISVGFFFGVDESYILAKKRKRKKDTFLL